MEPHATDCHVLENTPNDTEAMSLDGRSENADSSFGSLSFEDMDLEDTFSSTSRTFDMEVLRRGIENGSKILGSIEGKDVVLVLGKTGTGKSTLIQAIAGKKLIETTHATTVSSGTIHETVYEAEDPLPGFEIGHEKRSKTKYINAFVRKQTTGKDIVYLDSPGFEDTDGSEVDIATSVMLGQVAKKCGSLRLVVLINYASLLEDRGEAMRAVLKIVGTFVKSFVEHKKSFMFLFTHTDDIKTMSQASKAPEVALCEKILAIHQGTKDEDIKTILKFMVNSLKQNKPFVAVFQPLALDSESLVVSIEQKMNPIKDIVVKSNCGLSLKSQLELEVETQKLLQRLRMHLQNFNSETSQEVIKIQETIVYLSQYLDIAKVQAAAQVCKKEIEEHLKKQVEIITEEIDTGTIRPGDFSLQNIDTLKHALEQLSALGNDNISIHCTMDQMHNSILLFEENILMKINNFNFDELGPELDKLEVWSTGFNKFEELYPRVSRKLYERIREVRDETMKFDYRSFVDYNDTDIANHFKNLRVLSSFFEGFHKKFPEEAKEAISLYTNNITQMKSCLLQWGAESNSLLIIGRILTREDLNQMYSRAGFLEQLEVILSRDGFYHPSLYKIIQEVLSDLESAAVECYSHVFLRSFEDEKMKNQDDLSKLLQSAKKSSEAAGQLQGGGWKKITDIYLRLIGQVKSTVREACSDVLNRSMTAKKIGIKNGLEDAEKLMLFRSHIWFDEFLLPEEKFVESSCIRSQRNYLDRTEEIVVLAGALQKNLQNEEFDKCNILKELVPLLSELNASHIFASNIGDEYVVNKCTTPTILMNHYAQQLCDLAESKLSTWNDIMTNNPDVDDIVRLVGSLNEIICEVEIMKNIVLDESVSTCMQHIRIEILGKFEMFTEKMDSVMSHNGQYDDKVLFLEIAKELVKIPPHNRYIQLDFDDAKEKVWKSMIREWSLVESRILETSDWHNVDELRHEFMKALVLDKFFHNEVSSRVQTLQNLQEHRENYVDDILSAKLKLNDFRGIGELLSPLAESKKQNRRQKFELYKKRICLALQQQLQDVPSLLRTRKFHENGIDVANRMTILNKAQCEIGKHLTPELDLNREIQYLNEQINRKLLQFCDNILQGENNMDFSKVLALTAKIEVYYDGIRDYIRPCNSKEKSYAVNGYHRMIQTLNRQIDLFFKSRFLDHSELRFSLQNLQMAENTNEPCLESPKELYKKVIKGLVSQLNEEMRLLCSSVEETNCYDDAITVVAALGSAFKFFLHRHIVHTDLDFRCDALLNEWRVKRGKLKVNIGSMQGVDIREKMNKIGKMLDRLCPKNWKFFSTVLGITSGESYAGMRDELERNVANLFNHGKSACKSNDFETTKNCIFSLNVIFEETGSHVAVTKTRLDDLKVLAENQFVTMCKKAQKILLSDQQEQFERVFMNFRLFVLNTLAVINSSDIQKNISLVNQLVFETIQKSIKKLEVLSQSFDFMAIKRQVKFLRSFGGYIASNYAVFIQEVKNCSHIEMDIWMEKLSEVLYNNFKDSHDFKNIRYYVTLGIPMSASNHEVEKAFKKLVLIWHPDKKRDHSQDSGAMFRKVKEARDHLTLIERLDPLISQKKSFENTIRKIGENLRILTQTNLEEQQYECVSKFIFNLHDLHVLDELVDPWLDSQKIEESIKGLVKNHVEKVRVEVETNWKSRKYIALNTCIIDMQAMEKHFKAYPDIFSISWSRGIFQNVENEIEALAEKARQYLSSRAHAEKHLAEFKSCFLQMGFVFVELPSFRHVTKNVMSLVLESCLDGNWGYSFLFKFGLSLRRGSNDNDNEDENRVAKVLLSEFCHFKEVMTMVWNEEVAQKPVEESIMNLKAHLNHSYGNAGTNNIDIDSNALLESFCAFELEYKSLLSIYLDIDANLDHLTEKTILQATKIKPGSCNTGWDRDLKKQIPKILAGVFALFTVQKSGASYNRLVQSGGCEQGTKMLMQPHNIQVLTLLLMFGCGSPTQNALESQVMQIRTGEGKSMILGAAATMLGLLGFSVRCVCYSDYLSNRDFRLFEDVFKSFGLDSIKYSKITTLSEDTTARKGDIRGLTNSLLRGHIEGKESLVTCSTIFKNLHNPEINRQEEKDPSFEHDPQTKLELFSTAPTIRHCTGDESTTLSNKRRRVESKKNGNDRKLIFVERVANNEDNCEVDKFRASKSQTKQSGPQREEILLVDEVDVYFCPEFYGQTYNQVAQLREPEVAEIIRAVWTASKKTTRKLRLNDIISMSAYKKLKQKISGFDYLIDYEIRIMLDQVRRVDDEPYYLDPITNKIGYKVMDGISYEATYGYRTIFAYLKEAEKGNLKNKDAKLQEVLAMPISCGQFSYANVSPARILGVSGTVQAMGDYEKSVLSKYGINKFLYIPSVYGKSNFTFDKAGRGISIEYSMSDYFHNIVGEIVSAMKERRAVIVFFPDTIRLKEFTSSSYYRKLGRQKSLLTEDMNEEEKAFVIGKAATNGQATICPAVFGRGTDFFCKDERVEKNGGVHIIQAFLSADASEEVQIQGRTARQGKSGTYQMILLESDLISNFGVQSGDAGRVPKADLHDWLCKARDHHHQQYCDNVEKNLMAATQKDMDTHKYFDVLLAGDSKTAKMLFKEMYLAFKKQHLPSEISLDIAFAIDVSGSMKRYTKATISTLKQLLIGKNSLLSNLASEFPEIKFQLRVAVLGYRDIDDQDLQFLDNTSGEKKHFESDIDTIIHNITDMTSKSSGGFDIAEDHLGALARCKNWNGPNDWDANAKFIILFTDAPAHGMVPDEFLNIGNADNYPIRHPGGLTAENVVKDLILDDINLCFCSFNPIATSQTVEELKSCYIKNADNKNGQTLTFVPMVLDTDYKGSHIVFVLDQSASMSNDWGGVKQAYQNFIRKRLENQNSSDLVSVIQFDRKARVTVDHQMIFEAPNDLPYRGTGGTRFLPAAVEACKIAQRTPSSHVPTIVFMSDGETRDDDAAAAAREFSALNLEFSQQRGEPLDFHVIAFRSGANTEQLSMIAGSSPQGKLCAVHDSIGLSEVFVDIAASDEVCMVLQAEIGKLISDSVNDKLSLEYIKG